MAPSMDTHSPCEPFSDDASLASLHHWENIIGTSREGGGREEGEKTSIPQQQSNILLRKRVYTWGREKGNDISNRIEMEPEERLSGDVRLSFLRVYF